MLLRQYTCKVVVPSMINNIRAIETNPWTDHVHYFWLFHDRYWILQANAMFGFLSPRRRLFIRPSVTNLLGLYLKDYYIFEHETSGVYRSHWGEVHCTRTTTLHFLILELLPFVIFHTWILCLSVTNLLGLCLKDYYRFEHETSGVYISHWGEVHCTKTITLHFLIVELLSFIIFHTWILCPSVTNLLGLCLKDYYRFENKTSGVYISHWGEVHFTRTITLHFLTLEL